jgi:2TM domain
MPPRWPHKPDRRDPAFRRLDDRMNFAVHVAIFATVNSGAWFFKVLKQADWAWTLWMTAGWAALLFLHGLYIFGLANYSSAESQNAEDNKPERI